MFKPKVKNAVYEYHTCANPWTYNVSKDHCSKIGCNLVVIKWKDAVFATTQTKFGKSAMTNWEDGSVKGCKYSQEDCSTRRPGFKFRPYFHAEKAINIALITPGLPTDAVGPES